MEQGGGEGVCWFLGFVRGGGIIERTMSAVALFHQSPFGNIHVVDGLFLLVLAACNFVLVGSVDGDVERGAPRVGCTDREGWQ